MQNLPAYFPLEVKYADSGKEKTQKPHKRLLCFLVQF